MRSLSFFMTKTILIVGDVASAAMFENRGWAVITCSNLEIAMGRLFGIELYNVVLINSLIPLADALKLIKFARAIEHRRTTAIVMIAANSVDADEGKWAGADRVLISPVNADGLIRAIEEQAR